ncbi:MAG: ATP-binding protein [Candidatus Helarchaeota archaeon]
MGIFAIFSFVGAFIALCTGNYILYKSQIKNINRLLFIFSIVLNFWLFTEGLLFIAPSFYYALLYQKLSSIGILTIPLISHFNLSLAFNNKSYKMKTINYKNLSSDKRIYIYIFLYGPTLAFIFINMTTPLIISDPFYRVSWDYWYYGKAGNLLMYLIYIVWLCSLLIFSFIILIKNKLNNINKLRKIQFKYLIFGIGVPFSISIMLYLFQFGLIIDLPCILVIGMLISGFFLTYAIYRYKLIYLPKYSTIFDSIKIGMIFLEVIYKSEVPEDLICLNINNTFEKMSKISKSKLLFRRISEVLREYKDSPNITWIEHIFKFALRKKDIKTDIFFNSTNRWYSVSLYNIDSRFIIICAEDITDKKIFIMDVYKKYTELKKLYRLKEEFYADAIHEFKTPITIIKGFTELNLKHNNLEKSVRDEFEIINKNVKRLENSVEEILGYTRLNSGKIELKKDRFLLLDLIEELLNELAPLFKEKKLFVLQDFDCHIVIKTLDKSKISILIKNLLINAIKFSYPYGLLKIESFVENEVWRFSITDQGIGIDKKDIDKLFTRYTKIEDAKSMDYKGTGIGLALCKKIVDIYGGKIWAESKGLNKGAKFIFEIKMND